MKPPGSFTSIGGQAVIEGVMMRSPHFLAVAVRRPNQKIVIRYRSYEALSSRFPFLRKPVLRGVVTLLESMVQGMETLSFSAEIASENEVGGQDDGATLSSWAIAGSMILAIALGLGLFVALPHFLAALVTSANNPLFHLVDGLIKMGILLTYVFLIGQMKDIYRVFQYHGAEHKSIYTFEAGEDLTVENAQEHSTLHPRCGTSFLLFLVLISVLVFSAVFPLFGLTQLSSNPLTNHLLMVVTKIFLMLPVAGLSYEFIKACAFRMENPIFKFLIWPGLALQRLTTKEPFDDQVEVALAALKQVLKLEKTFDQPVVTRVGEQGDLRTEIEIADLSQLGAVEAQLAEFREL